MSICKPFSGPLLAAALLSLTACGGADCLRKSDCDSSYECHEGACVAAGGKAQAPAAGAGGASAGRAGSGAGGALTAGRGGAGGANAAGAGAGGRGGRGGASGSSSDTGGLDAGGTSDTP